MTLGSVRRLTPKQLAALIILIAMAMVLSFVEFPLFPNAPWLKYDPSAIVVFTATLLYGPWVGIGVSVLAWIPRLMSDPLGAFMNIMAAVSVVIVLGLIYRRRPNRRHAILGMVLGAVFSVAVSVALNFLVTPVYTGVSVAQVASTVMPTIVPFNALKLLINCTIALLSYRKLEQLLSEHDDDPAQDGDR